VKTRKLTGGTGPAGHRETTHGRGRRETQVLATPGQRRLPVAGPAALLPVASLGPDLPCTDDPELFFAESPEDVERAKASCRGCPGRAACLAGALERREPWGVWGGELILRGAILPRKRPRGRPRKTDVAA
jgi:WhiB family transcriptional regulator, redox-sensing transcriptional regulator